MRYRRKKTGALRQVLAGVSLTLFIFSAAVLLVLNCRPLYYLDITLLGIEKNAGMSADVIRRNFDALISYNQIWHRGALIFPTLPMSAQGEIHFAEVKRIFDVIWVICPVSLLLAAATGIPLLRARRRRFMKAAGICSIVLPLVLGVCTALNWDAFFVTFHHIFFRNDYWLFDPATDPVILMLPDTYFLHCAVLILLLVFTASIICLFAGRGSRYRSKKRRASGADA